MYAERHFIIVPVELEVQANAEAVKWDPDAGGAETFSAARLSSDGVSVTHLASNGLIEVDYLPPNQGGQTALQVLDAFYATSWYQGYRIKRENANDDALLSGDVEVWRAAHLDGEGVPVPAGWFALGTGNITDIAIADAGLQFFAEEEEPDGGGGGDGPDEWQTGVAYTVGQQVTYQGTVYECAQAHTSQTGWEPPNVAALWTAV